MKKHKITLGEMKAVAIEEQEKADKLRTQGICLTCEDSPQNPHIPAPVCLDCYESNASLGCSVTGCPNSGIAVFRQVEYCEHHFSKVASYMYQEYLGLKSELEDERESLYKTVEQVGTHPRELDVPSQQASEEMVDLYDEWVHLKLLAREVNVLKSEIQEAIEQDLQAFPDNYSVFG